MTVFEFLRSVTNSRKRTVETERHRVAEANKLTAQHADRPTECRQVKLLSTYFHSKQLCKDEM